MKTTRRNFLKNVGAGSALLTTGGAAAIGAAGALFTACSTKDSASGAYTPLHAENEIYIPELPDKAVDGKPLRAALVGCGSRGTGAAFNFIDAGDGLSVVALADLFPDKVERCRNWLKRRKDVDIAEEACFHGFDAYKKVCDLPQVDVILIASPNCFHPEQFKYAIDRGKHVFLEKPVAIDPVGYRTYMATLKQAKAQRLNVIAGTNMQWDRAYVESYKMVQAGYIGKILSGNVYYKTFNEQYLKRQPGWSDAEFMIRSFFNWNWINGDQISNVLLHCVNAFIWFSHVKPLNVSAIGSRVRRTAGNIYDNFSMDFEFEDGVRLFGMVRKMDGCDNKVGLDIQGTKGSWRSSDFSIRDLEGNLVWKFDEEAAKATYKTNDMYVLEHIDLVNHIRKDLVIDVAETNGISAMACIMARESAYSGKTVAWDTMVASDLNMLPTEFASGQLGKMDMKKYETVPMPGIAWNES